MPTRGLVGDNVGSNSLGPRVAWPDQAAVLPATDRVRANSESSRFAHATGRSAPDGREIALSGRVLETQHELLAECVT